MTQKLVSLKKKLTDHNYDKFITTPELNKLTAEYFAKRLAQANLITKIDFDAESSSLNGLCETDCLKGLSNESIKSPTTSAKFLNTS